MYLVQKEFAEPKYIRLNRKRLCHLKTNLADIFEEALRIANL